MTPARTVRRFCPFFLSLLVLAAAPVLAAGLRLGTAAVKITPPLGTPVAGYYSTRGSDGVLDDLYAKVAVLDDGRTQAALVVCDLITMPRATVLEARRLIQQQTGLPGSQVMISATHTHTGPVLTEELPSDEIGGGGSAAARKYTAELPSMIAQGVQQARSRLAPVRTSYARGHEDRLAFNRRFWMKDGTLGWNPGKHNPNTIRPASPIDPEVGVVYFETTDARPVLTYVNYAMHPDTTGGLKFWPDFPGVLAHRLAEYKGPEMLTIFGNGACGNINHVNVQWSNRQHGPEEAIRLGTILAGNVLKAYMDLEPAADVSLQVRSQVLALPLAPVTEKDLAEAREVIRRGRKAKFLEQVQAYKALDVAARHGKPWEAEVQVVALGREVAWVALPGEVFVELGLSIKAASPFRQTQIVELANGSFGYIPHRSAYAEGNYEVVSARCAEGSGEMLVTAATRILAELAPAAAQAGPPAKIVVPPH
jgi:hypothetical protein